MINKIKSIVVEYNRLNKQIKSMSEEEQEAIADEEWIDIEDAIDFSLEANEEKSVNMIYNILYKYYNEKNIDTKYLYNLSYGILWDEPGDLDMLKTETGLS